MGFILVKSSLPSGLTYLSPRFRNFILAHSNRIVQDDAGIPLAYFDPAKWNLRLFGNYLGPIELFKQHYQPKLQELFAQSNPPPLDFGFGYRWNYKEANLMVAERKGFQ